MGFENFGTHEWVKLAFIIGLAIGSFSMYFLNDLFEQPEPVKTESGLSCFPSYYEFEYSTQFNQSPEVTVIPGENSYYYPSNVSGGDS